MKDLLVSQLPLCFAASLIGWVWLIIIGIKNKGFTTGLKFYLLGYEAIIYGYKNWRHPCEKKFTNIPFFLHAARVGQEPCAPDNFMRNKIHHAGVAHSLLWENYHDY